MKRARIIASHPATTQSGKPRGARNLAGSAGPSAGNTAFGAWLASHPDMNILNTFQQRLAFALGVVLTVGLTSHTFAQTPSLPIHYTAIATNLDPRVNLTATLVDLSITRWSTDAEREKLLGLVADKGQDKLLTALE